MKFLATTIKGLEDVSSKEIEELLDAKIIEKSNGKIIFESEEEFLIRDLKSIDKVLLLIDKFKFDNLNDIKDKVSKANIKDYLKNTFRVRCSREGNQEFNSLDVEREIGEAIFKNNIQKVDLKNPDIVIQLIIEDNECIFGILKTKTRLSKRSYRVKVHAESINSMIAYCLVRLSDFKENETLLDPFCNDGVICIEAALFKKGKIMGFDERLGCIKSSRINSKIAKAQIEFENDKIDDLDKKFEKEEVDKIVTSISISKKNKKGYKTIFKIFFDKSKDILDQKGKIVVLTQKLESIKESAEENDFKLEKEIKLPLKDNQNNYILIFEKDLNKN